MLEMKVFRGTLVHSKSPERIEVLQNHVIGFDETDLGKVSSKSLRQAGPLHTLAT